MSRVWKPHNKFMNPTPMSPESLAPGPIKRTTRGEVHPENAQTFSSWYFLKYGKTIQNYKRKDGWEKECLREEYFEDTGRIHPFYYTLFPDPFYRISVAAELLGLTRDGLCLAIHDGKIKKNGYDSDEMGFVLTQEDVIRFCLRWAHRRDMYEFVQFRLQEERREIYLSSQNH